MTVEIELRDEEGNHEKLASGMHGEIAVNISGRLWQHLQQNRTGRIFDSSTTFQLSPQGPKREPDVAFVKLERLPESIDDVVPVAPDLAIEIISGSDDWKEVLSKALSYLQTGVGLVWVVDPYSRSVFVFTPARMTAFDTLRDDQELDADSVITGFKLKVSDIFAGIRPALPTY